MVTVTKHTWATIDLTNPVEVQALRDQEVAEAAQRVTKAVDELRNLGIVDSAGRRIRKTLPTEMTE